jgi:hypothetical protein
MEVEDGEQPSKRRRVEKVPGVEALNIEPSTTENMDEEPKEDDTIEGLFAHHTKHMLEWVWVTWIPELLSKLSQKSGPAYKVHSPHLRVTEPRTISFVVLSISFCLLYPGRN